MTIKSNPAREALISFFDKWPLDRDFNLSLETADFFIGQMWLRGFKIVPIKEEQLELSL